MFAAQNPKTGALPESGPPLSQMGRYASGLFEPFVYSCLHSDTYHMWSMIGVFNAFLYDGDEDFLENLWTNYTFALAYIQVRTHPGLVLSLIPLL